MHFTIKTNKRYVMINTAKFKLASGSTITLDRDRTEFTNPIPCAINFTFSFDDVSIKMSKTIGQPDTICVSDIMKELKIDGKIVNVKSSSDSAITVLDEKTGEWTLTNISDHNENFDIVINVFYEKTNTFDTHVIYAHSEPEYVIEMYWNSCYIHKIDDNDVFLKNAYIYDTRIDKEKHVLYNAEFIDFELEDDADEDYYVNMIDFK